MGCLINFAQRNADHEQISYTDTIAPILQEKCVVCHTEGGLGPWRCRAMKWWLRPDDARSHCTKRMPPWHADPHIGVWKNDKSLKHRANPNTRALGLRRRPRRRRDPLKDLQQK